MSNYSSVIITWSTVGDDLPFEYAARRRRDKNILVDIADALHGYVDGVIWGCGYGGSTMACENVAWITVNHFSPEEFWEAVTVKLCEMQVFYKSEEMYSYKPIKRPMISGR